MNSIGGERENELKEKRKGENELIEKRKGEKLKLKEGKVKVKLPISTLGDQRDNFSIEMLEGFLCWSQIDKKKLFQFIYLLRDGTIRSLSIQVHQIRKKIFRMLSVKIFILKNKKNIDLVETELEMEQFSDRHNRLQIPSLM